MASIARRERNVLQGQRYLSERCTGPAGAKDHSTKLLYSKNSPPPKHLPWQGAFHHFVQGGTGKSRRRNIPAAPSLQGNWLNSYFLKNFFRALKDKLQYTEHLADQLLTESSFDKRPPKGNSPLGSGVLS